LIKQCKENEAGNKNYNKFYPILNHRHAIKS